MVEKLMVVICIIVSLVGYSQAAPDSPGEGFGGASSAETPDRITQSIPTSTSPSPVPNASSNDDVSDSSALPESIPPRRPPENAHAVSPGDAESSEAEPSAYEQQMWRIETMLDLLISELDSDYYLMVTRIRNSNTTLDDDIFTIYATDLDKVKEVAGQSKYSELNFAFAEAKYALSEILPVYEDLANSDYVDSELVYTCTYDETGVVVYMYEYSEFEAYIKNHSNADMITIKPANSFVKTNPG